MLLKLHRESFFREEGRVIPCRWKSTYKSAIRSLEAESVRSMAESMGGCAKLKTVTDKTKQCAYYIYVV